jgi:hypothetical protein
MMIEWDTIKPIQTYKSYKAEKTHKYLERVRALRRGVFDSSLKDDDKRTLLEQMRKEL